MIYVFIHEGDNNYKLKMFSDNTPLTEVNNYIRQSSGKRYLKFSTQNELLCRLGTVEEGIVFING